MSSPQRPRTRGAGRARRSGTARAMSHLPMPIAVPSLDEIASDPALTRTLSPEARAAALVRCASVLAALAAPPESRESSTDSNASLAVLTTKRLAEMWQMPEAKIRELCRLGTLPARKLGPKEWVIAADALRRWLPAAPLAKPISLGLSSSHDPERASQPPQAARPYSVEVRRPTGRPQDHGRQMGGGDEGDERHDRTATADHRAAGTTGARTASGDDSPSKGALT